MKNSAASLALIITGISVELASGQVTVASETIVFDNNAGGASGIDQFFASDADSGFLQADDFSFASTTTVTGVQWTGVYAGSEQTPPSIDNFVISIIGDLGGAPSGAPIASFAVGNAVSRIDSGEALFGGAVPIYAYEADINFTFNAATTFWLSISTDTSNDPEDNYSWGSLVNQGNNYFSQDDGATWTASTFPSRHDFRLIGVPEPSTMMLVSLCALTAVRRRRR